VLDSIVAGPSTFNQDKCRNKSGTPDSTTAVYGDTLACLQSCMNQRSSIPPSVFKLMGGHIKVADR
jgi:hypothetical protein